MTEEIIRPFIHINCASTVDGKIALPDGGRLNISTPWDKSRVHRLRANLGSVLVGAGTVISDDPKLTVNPEYAGDRKDLIKIVLDGSGRIPPSARFFRTEGRSIVVTTESCSKDWLHSIRGLSDDVRLRVIVLPGGPGIDIPECLGKLKEEGSNGILVEGGSETISNFLASGLFDLFTVFYGPIVMGGKGPTIAGGPGFPNGPIDLRLSSVQRPKGGGLLVEYTPVR